MLTIRVRTLKTTSIVVTLLTAVAAGCASAPRTPPAPPVQFSDKLAWILQLEDRRILREAEPPATVPATPPAGRRAAAAAPPRPDLVRLAGDADVRVRRRALVAIGRVGLAEGYDTLARALRDPDANVRESAAFALGLLGDRRADAPLGETLQDPDPAVRGRAAEALGLLGAEAQAVAIADMALAVAPAGTLAPIAPDDLTYPMPPEVEAARLAIYALVRLKSFDQLARVVLDEAGKPVSSWWPVAYALRRLEDPRAAVALRALLAVPGRYTRAFAARGLGVIKAGEAVPDLLPLAADVVRQPSVAVEAIRSLGDLRDRAAAPVLRQVLAAAEAHPGIRAEAATALGAVGQPDEDGEFLLDYLSDDAPSVRAAALRALAVLDQDRFLLALSGRDPDAHWNVRAALADALSRLPAERAAPLLLERMEEGDQRVIPSLLAALVKVRPAEAEARVLGTLQADDAIVRAAAAAALSELCPSSASEALRRAFEFGRRDSTAVARSEALEAMSKCDRDGARALAKTALEDRDWSIRLQAARLLRELEPDLDTAAVIRPAPSHWPLTEYGARGVVSPPYSTHAYFDTDYGTFQVEFAMLDAPMTVHNFVTLARRGYYDGLSVHRVVPGFVVQDGDPRGDGAGGPGYTIRDELNRRPYLRGTVGMALSGPDTGGSQYFITHGPQPHLDARYTAFGQVISGMEIVEKLRQWDVIRRVRIWDGETGELEELEK